MAASGSLKDFIERTLNESHIAMPQRHGRYRRRCTPARGVAPQRRVRRERGSVSVEFALIFPALFVIFYAIVTYGLIFAAQHTLALAAAEGGRAALRYQRASNAAESLTLRKTAASNAAHAPLSWLNGVGGNAVTVTSSDEACAYDGALTCITVRVTYDYTASPLVPNLLGDLLKLPAPPQLHSQAVVQVNPAYML